MSGVCKIYVVVVIIIIIIILESKAGFEELLI